MNWLLLPASVPVTMELGVVGAIAWGVVSIALVPGLLAMRAELRRREVACAAPRRAGVAVGGEPKRAAA